MAIFHTFIMCLQCSINAILQFIFHNYSINTVHTQYPCRTILCMREYSNIRRYCKQCLDKLRVQQLLQPCSKFIVWCYSCLKKTLFSNLSQLTSLTTNCESDSCFRDIRQDSLYFTCFKIFSKYCISLSWKIYIYMEIIHFKNCFYCNLQ